MYIIQHSGKLRFAAVARAEHSLGKGEAESSNLSGSTIFWHRYSKAIYMSVKNFKEVIAKKRFEFGKNWKNF